MACAVLHRSCGEVLEQQLLQPANELLCQPARDKSGGLGVNINLDGVLAAGALQVVAGVSGSCP